MSAEAPDEAERLAKWAKGFKQHVLDDAGAKGNTDIRPVVAFWRAGQLVAQGFADSVDRDRGLQLATMGTYMYGADQIDLVNDTYTATGFEEHFGRLPDPGEFARLFEQGSELVTEALSLMRCRLDQTVAFMSLPYRVEETRHQVEFITRAKGKKAARTNLNLVREGDRWFNVVRRLRWSGDEKLIEGPMGGRVTRALLAAMSKPSFIQAVQTKHGFDLRTVGDQFGLDEHRARLHLDLVASKVLTTFGFPVMMGADNEEDLEVIQRSLARHDILTAFNLATGQQIPHDPGAEPQTLQESLLEVQMMQRADELRQEAEQSREDDMAEALRRELERGPDGGPSEADRRRLAEVREKGV